MAQQLTMAEVMRCRRHAMTNPVTCRDRKWVRLTLDEAVAAFPWRPRESAAQEHGTRREIEKGCRCGICADHAERLGLIAGDS